MALDGCAIIPAMRFTQPRARSRPSCTVTAGTPLALSSVDVPIGQTRRLTLTVTPSSGAVEGLSGTVNYKTP